MQLILPKASTASKFFTSTNFFDNFLAVTDKTTVIAPTNPSGTLATRNPMNRTRQVTKLYLSLMAPANSAVVELSRAIIVIIITNLSSSTLRGDLPISWE